MVTSRKGIGGMESSEGYISHSADRYVLAGRSGVDDHVLSVGDMLELALGGRYQTVCVASGGYHGYYYRTLGGERARFALCMRARLASR